MKKTLYLLFLLAFGLRMQAQTITLAQLTPSCDSNGVLVATAPSSATPPILFSWYTPEGFFSDSVNAMTDTLRGFMGGYVLVSAYEYLTGTSDSSTSATFNGVVNVTVNGDTVICPAPSVLTATVTGGTAPYTYQWSSGTGIVGTTNPVSGLPQGYYSLIVHDNAGCVFSTITQHYEIGVTVLPDFTYSFNITGSSICPSSDTEIAYHSGGVAPFTIQWFSGFMGSGGTLVGTRDTLLVRGTGIPYQDYGIITDAIGCTAVGQFDLAATSDFYDSVNTTTANCTNGTAAVGISGGIRPFSYLWSTGATSDSISGLIAGTYTVMVTDSAGCSALSYAYISQGIIINVNPVNTLPTCLDSNGAITVFGSGGTPPYSYLWNTGATTATIGGLTPNTYNVTATDANGCTGNIWDYLSASTPITVTYTTTPSSCTSPTGSAYLTIAGGTSPYTVTWYTTPARSGPFAGGLAPGNYSFYITDAVGCSQTGTVTIPPIDVISLTFTAGPATCALANGWVNVAATGGVAPYSYFWTGASSVSSTLNSVVSGLYYVTVTDANHCAVTHCQEVPNYSPLVLGLSTTEASCLYTADGTVTASAILGTPPYNYSMGGSATGPVTVTGLLQGNYWEYVIDSEGCTASQYFNIGYNVSDSSCFCVLQGNVYYDMNHNCVQDIGEPGIDNIQLNCASLGYTYSDTGGHYYFLVPSGSYHVSENILSFYPLSPCQVNDIPITATATTGCVITQNFADTVDPIHDMSVYTWDFMFAIPGNTYTQATLISNNGTQTESNVLASYTPDGQFFAPTFVPSGIFTGAPYAYNTSASPYTLSPGSSTLFLNSYFIPSSVPLGTSVIFKDSVAYQAPMSNWLTDYSPWNNVDYFTTVTVASHDPNFKEVSPVGNGPQGYISSADSVLTYMVHFQNTGNFMAQNVVVKDTLDANLDWTSLRPLYLEYKGKVDMDNSGHVTFTFPNIDLPDSTANPVNSQAMFTYTIKTKRGMPIGTTFKNTASIYFDKNAPVITNQTLNTLWFPASVTNVNGGSSYSTFDIFPNPAENLCYADINSEEAGNSEIRIIDITGKTMLHKTIALEKGNQHIPIETTMLSPGMYYVTIYGMGMTQTQKLVILK